VCQFKPIKAKFGKRSYFVWPDPAASWMSKYRNSTGPMHDIDYLLCPDGQFGNESWLPNTNETVEGLIYGSGRTVFH
jgi:hypothetical protein